jgi:hypothetical protein
VASGLGSFTVPAGDVFNGTAADERTWWGADAPNAADWKVYITPPELRGRLRYAGDGSALS